MSRQLFSSNIFGVEHSATLAVANKVRSRREKGLRVIDLGLGEPMFRTPASVGAAAVQAISDGHTHYTAVEGLSALRAAIAMNTEHVSGRVVKPEQVVVTTGSKQALFNACFVLFEEGDEVMIPTPAWPTYSQMLKLARAEPVAVRGAPSNDWKISADILADAATDRTRGLVLNSPCNPTGAVYSREELEDIVRLATDRDWWVISDEIYRDLIYDAEPASVMGLNVSNSKIIVVGGVAKSFAMTGWRIGWAIGPEEVIDAMTAVQSNTTSNACTISQYAALDALTSQDAAAERRVMLSVLRARREMALEILSSVSAEFSYPGGAFYLFFRVADNAAGASEAFASRLLDENGVVVVPGSAFGAEGWIRASYAGLEEDLTAGLNAIASSLKRG
jgi:aspartate aminotransferase